MREMAEEQSRQMRLVNMKLEAETQAVMLAQEANRRQAEAWEAQAEYWRRKTALLTAD